MGVYDIAPMRTVALQGGYRLWTDASFFSVDDVDGLHSAQTRCDVQNTKVFAARFAGRIQDMRERRQDRLLKPVSKGQA